MSETHSVSDRRYLADAFEREADEAQRRIDHVEEEFERQEGRLLELRAERDRFLALADRYRPPSGGGS